jgi:hypothetical protein
MKRNRIEKWSVYGEYGGHFTNLKDAKICAKEYSIISPDEVISIYLESNGCYYIDYQNGKIIRDGWTIKK